MEPGSSIPWAGLLEGGREELSLCAHGEGKARGQRTWAGRGLEGMCVFVCVCGCVHGRGRCFLYAVSSLKRWLTQADHLQMNLGSACWGETDFPCGVSVPGFGVGAG